jgi:hypothetical protein
VCGLVHSRDLADTCGGCVEVEEDAPLLYGRLLRWSSAILAAPLAGCNWVVMNPSGDIAVQQRDLILISTALMLLIVIPVMALVVYFAWSAWNSRLAKGEETAG